MGLAVTAVARERRYALVLGTIALGGGFTVVFDILRKTVFLGAWWNYDYPASNLVYDPLAVGLLAALMVAVALLVNRLLDLPRREFLMLLYGLTIAMSALAFFATPLRTARWLNPQGGYYRAALFAARNGPLEYFAAFHSLPAAGGTAPEAEAARTLARALARAEYVPWNESLSAYAAEIKANKHGPIPPLLASPFLVLLGGSVGNASLGSYAITTTLPLVAYVAARVHFPDRESRICACFVLFAPTYLIFQRFGAIAWDAISGVIVGVAVYLVLRGVRDDSLRVIAAAGVVFSLAILSKISTLPVGAALVLILLVGADAVRFGKRAVTLGAASLAVPVALLFAGYNVLMQFLFSLTRVAISTGADKPAGHPAAYLNNPVLWIAGPVYNARLLGPPLLLFVGTFVLYAGHRLLGRRGLDRTELVSVALTVSLLPFALVLPGRAISRHLLPLLVPLGLVGIQGFRLLDLPERAELRVLRASLLVTAGLTLVGI